MNTNHDNTNLQSFRILAIQFIGILKENDNQSSIKTLTTYYSGSGSKHSNFHEDVFMIF